MGPHDFVAELNRLGYETTALADRRVCFRYVIPVGPRAGQTIELGLAVPPDFPLTCPGGPVLRPRLLPLNPDGALGHPFGAVHASPNFGEDWEYLSRPYPGWLASNRSVAAYMAHVANLFEAIP